jgi:threonine/homoserine/homoserine lactone efflux protein
MFGIENYLGFIIAGVVLNLTPGADTMYILTRSIAQGRSAGYYSVYGISTGGLIHTIFASLGLSIVLAKSVVLFMIVKYLGVSYLIYLGLKIIKEKNITFESNSKKIRQLDLWKIYRQGLVTNILNPKVALFFLAFLPQFVNSDHVNGPLPFLALGLTFVTTGTLWCLFLAYASSFLTKTIRNNDRIVKILQKVSGLVFIGLGVKLLTNKR